MTTYQVMSLDIGLRRALAPRAQLAPAVGTRPRAEHEPPSVGEPSPSDDGLLGDATRFGIDLAMLTTLAAATAAVAVLPASAWRTASLFLAALLGPGAAIMTRLRSPGLLHGASLALGLSLALEAAVSTAMVELRIWDPYLAAAVIAAASAALLVADVVQRRPLSGQVLSFPAPRGSWLRAVCRGGLLPMVAGVALWAVTLTTLHNPVLDENGLLDALPASWYAAIALCALGCTVEIARPRWSPWVAAAGVAAVAVLLYATIPWLERAPQYAYVYKHIGVTRLILATGRVFPNVDIYNRWPAFFALAAWFAKLAGTDPLSFAKLFEPVFAVVDLVIVAAIARHLTGSGRVAALGSLLWLGLNWVGQGYFSPQAFAFTLGLVVMLVLILALADERWPLQLVRRLSALLVRRPQPQRRPSTHNPWGTATTVAGALALFAPTVAAHQLTPYMLCIEAAILVAAGLRPWWLPAAMAALAVAWLIPNLAFVDSHWGLLSGLDPLSNAKVAPGVTIIRPWLLKADGRLITAIGILLACGTWIALARAGCAGAAALLGALMFAPYTLVAVSSYGGEGILRAALFSSPWVAILIAWGLMRAPRCSRLPLSAAVTATLVGLLIVGLIGNAALTVIPRPEVTASDYFYAHAPAGSILMQAGDNFPAEVGPRYRLMALTATEASPDMFGYPWATASDFGAGSLEHLTIAMNALSLTPFVVFSTSGYHLVDYEHQIRPGSLADLERAVAASPLFRLWYANPDTRIYELVG